MSDNRNIFLLIIPLFFLNCAPDSESPNLRKPTLKGIKSIVFCYQSQEKYDNYAQTARESIINSLVNLDESLIEDTELLAGLRDGKSQLIESQLEDYLFKDRNSEEYQATFVDMEVKEEYWEMVINELRKPKKKKGIFSLTRQPGGFYSSIKITYIDGKETNVILFLYNYFDINDVWYHYGKGANFSFMDEIITSQNGQRRKGR